MATRPGLTFLATAAVAACALATAAAGATGTAARATSAAARGPVSLLFVLNAASGTLRKGTGTAYTLTLASAQPRSVAFSDAPTRVATMIRTKDLVALWHRYFPDGARPNAALNLAERDAQKNDTVILELGPPALKGATVTFPARLLGSGRGRIGSFDTRQRAAVPASFRQAALFIDDGTECGALPNQDNVWAYGSVTCAQAMALHTTVVSSPQCCVGPFAYGGRSWTGKLGAPDLIHTTYTLTLADGSGSAYIWENGLEFSGGFN